MTPLLTTGQLLDLSPDKLLETHTVAEATAVGQQLTKEVDKKREELRVMVGERYRDLIEAADTIQSMRLCSSSVIQSVTGMQQSCRSLQHQSALHAVTSLQSKTDLAQPSTNTPYLAVAASIKLLTAAPELIWAAVEDGNFSLSAQLFLLAQHVHTGLQADAGDQVTCDKIGQWFPVIARQWATIQQLQSTLLNSCQTKLSAQQLSEETAVDTMTAIMLLRNWTVEQIFEELLKYRSSSLASVLESGRTDSARTATCSTVNTIIASVQAVHSLFIEGSLIKSLTTITSQLSPPTLDLVGSSTLGPIGRHLPNPVLQFRPRLKNEMKSMLKSQVVEHMKKWMDSVNIEAKKEARALFEYVTNVEGLAGVREGLYQLLKTNRDNWMKVAIDTLGHEVCLWDTLYRQLVKERVVDIIKQTVVEAVENIELEVKKVCNNWKQQQGETFMWTEAASDLGSIWGNGKVEKRGLMMKCWGWNYYIQDLCGGLDVELGNVTGSLVAYTRGLVEEGGFDKYSDSEDITEEYSNILMQELVKLVVDLKSMYVKDTDNMELTLLLARLYQAILSLTPNLVLCLKSELKGNNKTNLKQATTLFMKEAEELFNLWITSNMSQFTTSLSSLSPDCILTSLPAWDKVSISETAESGQEVISIIYIPPSPSQPLIHSLLSLASTIHKSNPCSFPQSTLVPASIKVVQAVLSHYTSFSTQTLTQNFALQLLFDLYFIQTLLVSRDSKDTFSNTFSTLISSFESNIDPFDLSVFEPHVQARVKKAAARSISGLGSLVPADRVAIINSYKTPSSSSQETHNILCVETQPCPRFQLLPLAPGSKVSTKPLFSSAHLQLPIQASIDTKKTAASKRSRSRSPVHQTAASFFGSMSWFGANS